MQQPNYILSNVYTLDSIRQGIDIVKYMYSKGGGMKKKLYKSGNAWVLLIQRAFLQLLDLNPETDEVEIDIKDKVMYVKKAEKRNDM